MADHKNSIQKDEERLRVSGVVCNGASILPGLKPFPYHMHTPQLLFWRQNHMTLDAETLTVDTWEPV